MLPLICLGARAIMDIRAYAIRCYGRKLDQATSPWVAMQQIADWLKKLGTPDYTERFVESQHDPWQHIRRHGARAFSR